MSGSLKEFTVYTRTRGNVVCKAYNRRHALATAVTKCAAGPHWDPQEVCAWCIAERRGEGGAGQ